MRSLYNEETMEEVLLIDNENAFDAVNRRRFYIYINVTCRSIAIFVYNCYSKPSCLFVIGGVEILPSEGTTLGDLDAIAVYVITIMLLIVTGLSITNQYPSRETSKEDTHADGLKAAKTFKRIKYWWEKLCKLDPNF